MQAALVFFKVHRFEGLVAFLVPAGLGLWAIWIAWQLNSIGIPGYCIHDWLIDGLAQRPECATQMSQWGAIASGTDPFFASMAIGPIAMAILASVPVVASELEGRTAAFSWWLFPSRLGWLARQGAATGIPFLLVAVVAALAATLVANADHEWGGSAFQRIGLHGVDAIARATAAFGIGLLAGAVAARTIPGLILAACLIGAVSLGVTLERDAWISKLEPTVIGAPDPISGELVVQPRAVFSRWGTADGQQVMFGVSEEQAMGWEPLESACYGSTAGLAILGAVVVVRKRRPR